MKFKLITVLLFGSISLLAGNEVTRWDDYFMPGAGYKVFAPKNSKLGVYQGFVTEFVTYARSRRAFKDVEKSYYQSGPARLKTFMNLSILSSSEATSKDIFYWNCGASVSFEGAKSRNVLLPFFGLETGTMYQRDFGTFQLTPKVGLFLVANQRVMWTVHAGHQYTTHAFDEWSGFTSGTTLNFLLWN